jgi:RHS repeat-associated protein
MGDWAFQYDTLNRLTAAAPADNAPTLFAHTIGCFGYDSFGNRTLNTYVTAGDCTGANTPNAMYNANNQVTFVSQSAPISYSAPAGFTYDGAGNVKVDGNNQYAYDPEGRICAVYSSITMGYTGYLYNAGGQRVASGSLSNLSCNLGTNGFSLKKNYLLDQSGNQVTELNQTGGWVHSNVWVGAHLDATYDTLGLHFHLADPLGTRRVQANVLGQIEETCQSLPFGDALNCVLTSSLATADDATEHHFTGKERDTESGNDYFGARYYSSSMGRFMSPDWSAKEDPVPYAQLDDPQSLNLYAYVRNNPLSKADPDGHCPECAVWEQEAEPYIEDYGSQAGQWLQQNGTEAAAWVGATAAAGYAAVKGWFSYKPGADFSPKTKKDTATAAAGTCALCGTKTTPAEKSKKGVTPPSNEGQTDHKKAKSKGGTNDPSNAQHTCRQCNREKSDKDVPPAPAPPPPPPPPPPPTPPPPAGA